VILPRWSIVASATTISTPAEFRHGEFPASSCLLVARAGFCVTGDQIGVQLLVLSLDRADLRFRSTDVLRVDIEDADQRFPRVRGHPPSLLWITLDRVGGNQYEREHEDDLDEQIDERGQGDIAIPVGPVPLHHRRYSTLLRMKREASMR
jgi:hypothetical protein